MAEIKVRLPQEMKDDFCRIAHRLNQSHTGYLSQLIVQDIKEKLGKEYFPKSQDPDDLG